LLLGEWVEPEHHSLVGEWVLLGLIVGSFGNSGGSELGLNGIRVNDSGEISAGHDGSVQRVTRLLDGVLEVGSVKAVKSLEGILGEDNESTEVTTWGELEDVKSTNVASVNTWEVSSGRFNLLGLITVDDEWSLSHDVLGVSVFTLTGSDGLGGSDLSEIIIETDVGEGRDEGFGVWDVQVSEDEWEFWDVLDLVTSGHDQWSDSGGSKGGTDGMSSLGDIDSSVPFSPDLEWSEHSSLSAHVTEGSLTRSRGTGSLNSWDSCDGSTGSPGGGGVFLTGLVEDGVTLSSVLGKFRVDEVDKIASDWCRENTWHWDASVNGSVGALID